MKRKSEANTEMMRKKTPKGNQKLMRRSDKTLQRKAAVPASQKPSKKRKPISVQSRKAKGRRLQHWVCQKISDLIGLEWGSAGQDKPIESRGMGQSGTDVRLEWRAKQRFPYSVECKAQETMSVPNWVRQAMANEEPGTRWLLVCKQSNRKPVIIMDGDAFFELVGERNKYKKKAKKRK